MTAMILVQKTTLTGVQWLRFNSGPVSSVLNYLPHTVVYKGVLQLHGETNK